MRRVLAVLTLGAAIALATSAAWAGDNTDPGLVPVPVQAPAPVSFDSASPSGVVAGPSTSQPSPYREMRLDNMGR